MKRLLLLVTLGVLPLLSMGQAVVGDPYYYGQIYVDNDVVPDVVYVDPTIVQPGDPDVYAAPLYFYVPPTYYENWPYYCSWWNACSVPVYFVTPTWYSGIYRPWYFGRYPYGRPGFIPRGFNHWHHGGFVPRVGGVVVQRGIVQRGNFAGARGGAGLSGRAAVGQAVVGRAAVGQAVVGRAAFSQAAGGHRGGGHGGGGRR